MLKKVVAELAAAGWTLNGNQMVNSAGAPFAFEILVTNKEDERLGLAYQRVLERIGIAATIRTVDSTQYQLRRKTFDYDMVRNTWGAVAVAGQRADQPLEPVGRRYAGSFNYPGAKEPAIDAMIQAMVSGRNARGLRRRRAGFRRVLISGFYSVPLFYLPEQWIAHWNRIEHPDKAPLMGPVLATWWAKP